MREIFRDLRRTRDAGRGCVYCSVVETRGSTPQKAGAVMVVHEDGGQSGTLGGGCVEAEVRQQSLRLLETRQPAVLTYTLDDDYGWDDGLICGGRMTFLADPIPLDEPIGYFDELSRLIDEGRGGTEAVVFDPLKADLAEGARFLFDDQGRLIGSRRAMPADAASVQQNLKDLADRPRPYSQNGVAFLPLLPRCRLILVGAGHVGQAVAELAHAVDFDVWVLDDREKYACAERFPRAQRILVGDIGRELKGLAVGDNDYCLIVTRGHSHDEEALYHLAMKPARYVGMIGSKRKIRMIFDDLEKEGIPPEALERVYAPLGVDIGSQTVPEIAVSIVAQLVGHRNLGADAFPPPACRGVLSRND